MEKLTLFALGLFFILTGCSKQFVEERRYGFIPYDYQKYEHQAQEDRGEKAFTPSAP